MAKHYDKQFKLDAVQYYHDHKNLGLQGCATNLGISQQTLSRWQKELRETGDIESRLQTGSIWLQRLLLIVILVGNGQVLRPIPQTS